jgi:hypothetical protein
MAEEALSLHIQGMIEDGDRLPFPSKLEEIMNDPDYNDASAFLVVTVPDSKPRTIRPIYTGIRIILSNETKKQLANCKDLPRM